MLLFFIYHTNLESKINSNNFNQKYVSNYLSALIFSNKKQNLNSLKYFNSSKPLISKHEKFLENYFFSLVENDKIDKAIAELKKYKDSSNTDFFEAKILLISESIKKKDYSLALDYLNTLKVIEDNDNFKKITYETLKNYINLFLYKKIDNTKNEYGKFSEINYAFQKCYLDINSSNSYFLNLINSDDGRDYSRYLYFYLNNIVRNKDFISAEQIASTINVLNSTLLISQSKKFIENKNYNDLITPFSCKNPEDLLSEFFFLISNLYNAQNKIKASNFYLKVSMYLNKKFYFNLSLLAENYYVTENFNKSKKVLREFKGKGSFYNWYRIKKIAQIISIEENEKQSLKYIKRELKLFDNPNYKILFDVANIYKNFEKYDEAINYYNLVLKKIELGTDTHADVLYRRGSSFERMKIYDSADNDLIKSLEISPGDPYVLNYLAYSWLERKYKIDVAMNMLLDAYNYTENNPYIIDSLGWAYFLIGDYDKAEKYINQAMQLRPNDPVIMNHYADILWKIDRKLEANYFWKGVLKIGEFKDIDEDELKRKLIFGLDNL